MGNFLNGCKKVRKHIAEIDAKINEAIVAWKKIENGHMQVAIYFPEEAKKIKEDVKSLVKELELIDLQLEKDSEARPYYASVYNKCMDFLNGIE